MLSKIGSERLFLKNYLNDDLTIRNQYEVDLKNYSNKGKDFS